MAHPYKSQADSSQRARLKRLGATAGKTFGSSSMYPKKSYPSKGAGTSRELTIEGGSAKKRADRPANHFASGGFVGGGGGKKKSRKGHSTTNIVIASPGGGGQGPVPVPVPRPVPIPVRVGGPPGLPPGAAAAPRPPMAPPGAGGPPINVNVPPPAAAGPIPMPGPRPPGMAGGGLIGSTYHNWGKGFANGGSVKKKANGGFLRGGPPGVGISQSGDTSDRPDISVSRGGSEGVTSPGPSFGGLKGGPPPPDAPPPLGPMGAARMVSANFKKGGAIKKRQFGGGTGQAGLGPQLAGPRKPFTPAAAPGARPGAKPPVVPLTGGRPTRPGYKKGGGIKKYANGGGGFSATDNEEDNSPQASSTSVTAPADSKSGGLGGVMKALTGVDRALNPSTSKTYGEKSAMGAMNAAEATGRAVAGSTQALARANQSAGFKPGAVPGATGKNMFQVGAAKDGGKIKGYKAGGATGLGRLQKRAAARAVPAKTEI